MCCVLRRQEWSLLCIVAPLEAELRPTREVCSEVVFTGEAKDLSSALDVDPPGHGGHWRGSTHCGNQVYTCTLESNLKGSQNVSGNLLLLFFVLCFSSLSAFVMFLFLCALYRNFFTPLITQPFIKNELISV